MWWKKKNRIICFDLGGTHLRKAVVDFSLKKPIFLDFQKEKVVSKNKLAGKILEYAQKAGKQYRTTRVAFSSAGIVDNGLKKVFQAPQCYGEKMFSFSFLEKAGFQVFLENDGRSFGWGSFVFELEKKPQSVLSLVLGTEVGGGFIVDGKLHRGNNFSALEVSRAVFDQKRWGEFAAGGGIKRQYHCLTEKKKSAQAIFELAKKKDELALQVLQSAQNQFSLGLANLINILDPEIIVLGGTMVEERKKYFQEAIKASQPWIFNQKIKPKVFFSSLGERANLLGVGDLSRRG